MPYLVLAFLSLLWGTSFLLIKIASQSFDGAAFAFGRSGIAAVTLVGVALMMRAKWPRAPRLWGKMAALAIAGQALPFLLFGIAAHMTTSADMALMMGAMPIFTFVLARVLGLNEVWNMRAALGLAVGLAGVAISLASPLAVAGAAAEAAPGLGRALSLLGALGFAAGALLSRDVSREIGAAMTATGSMLISSALLFVLMLATSGPPSPAALLGKPIGPLAALIALGVFNTALAYFVYFRLIATAGGHLRRAQQLYRAVSRPYRRGRSARRAGRPLVLARARLRARRRGADRNGRQRVARHRQAGERLDFFDQSSVIARSAATKQSIRLGAGLLRLRSQ